MDISNKINFDFATTQKLIKQISQIDSFKGRWQAVENRENMYLKELRKIATIQSIGSSTRIEGATLTDKEVKELLANVKITKLTSRDKQEVMGYYDTLEMIYDSYSDIPLTENNIKSLHSTLLKYSTKDERHKGNYKNLSNRVVAKYPGGIEKTIFRTTEPHLVGKEIEELLLWTNTALDTENMHPLIVIGTFVYEFLSIHPFQDGNGRLSRLLTTLLLLRSNYPFIQYVSFENMIEQRKSDYYRVLMDGQKNRYSDNERIDAWLLFFFDCLVGLTERLDAKYNNFKAKGGYLNERQKKIVEFIKAGSQPVKVSEIALALPEFPLNTIRKDLLYLRDEKAVIQIGVGRGTVYVAEQPVRPT
jgi:Fic family protein